MTDVAQAAAVLRPLVEVRRTRVLVVLGSGLHPLAEGLGAAEDLPYADIPGFPEPTVPGHLGRAVFGDLEGVQVACMLGRPHLYEGLTPAQVVLPVRAFARAGVDVCVLTNAAGGLGATPVGAIVLAADHINLSGANPLASADAEEHGPRFLATAGLYDARLRAAMLGVGVREGLDVREGVYAGVLGPSFETPAEAAMLARLGADVVGMSTVLEALAARQAGMRVAAASVVANVAGSASDAHDAVLARVRAAVPPLRRMVAAALVEVLG